MASPALQPGREPEFRWWHWLGIVLGFAISYVKALVWSHGIVNAEVIGYAAGALLFPSIIAYLIAGVRKRRNWNKFILWYLAISVLFFGIELANSTRVNPT